MSKIKVRKYNNKEKPTYRFRMGPVDIFHNEIPQIKNAEFVWHANFTEEDKQKVYKIYRGDK